MYALVLLAVALASTVPEASPSAPEGSSAPPQDTTRTIQWKVRGISYALEVARTQAGDLALVGRQGEYLRSIVGPMMSTLHRRTWQGETATYRTLEISTETQGAYAFDLVTWLDKSGQSGAVLRQILESSTCDFDGKCGAPLGRWPARPQCPSADSLASYDGGFLEMSRLLVDAQCFTEEQLRIQPEGLWVDDYDGQQVTVALQRERCKASTSACDGRVSFVTFRPPRAWSDWLENASAGRGYLPRTLATAHDAGPVKAPVAEDTAPSTPPAPPSAPASPEPSPDVNRSLPAPPKTSLP